MVYDALRLPVYGALIVVLVFNLSQRSHLEHGEKKRFASLFAAGVILIFAVGLFIVDYLDVSPLYHLVPLFVAAALAYGLRKRIAVFRLHCENCGRPMNVKRTLYFDDNLCASCAESFATLSAAGERATQFPDGVPLDVAEIDWSSWQPDETAVLCFLRRENEVLLIRKKRGLGAGKVNAPGGRIEAGESAAQAAIRETEEEIGVTPFDLDERVHLSFIFTNGYSLRGTVFFAGDFSGEPRETEEATPFWCELSKIPFEQMWEDDSVWLPRALDGERLDARFVFDGERMASLRVEPLSD